MASRTSASLMASETRKRLAVAQHAARRQLDGRDAGLGLGERRRPLLPAMPSTPTRRHVAFQQRVGGLRGAVGEEDDLLGRDARLRQHLAEHLDHAAGDPARMRRAW